MKADGKVDYPSHDPSHDPNHYLSHYPSHFPSRNSQVEQTQERTEQRLLALARKGNTILVILFFIAKTSRMPRLV